MERVAISKNRKQLRSFSEIRNPLLYLDVGCILLRLTCLVVFSLSQLIHCIVHTRIIVYVIDVVHVHILVTIKTQHLLRIQGNISSLQ